MGWSRMVAYITRPRQSSYKIRETLELSLTIFGSTTLFMPAKPRAASFAGLFYICVRRSTAFESSRDKPATGGTAMTRHVTPTNTQPAAISVLSTQCVPSSWATSYSTLSVPRSTNQCSSPRINRQPIGHNS